MPEEVRIDRLVLRLPATSRDEGLRVAEAAVRELARTLPARLPARTVGLVRTQVSVGDPVTGVAGTVAGAIARCIR